MILQYLPGIREKSVSGSRFESGKRNGSTTHSTATLNAFVTIIIYKLIIFSELFFLILISQYPKIDIYVLNFSFLTVSCLCNIKRGGGVRTCVQTHTEGYEKTLKGIKQTFTKKSFNEGVNMYFNGIALSN